MLILSRRVNQAINIRNDIKIVVLGHHGNNVALGIEAPIDLLHYSTRNRLKKEQLYHKKIV